jgi:hypothetical protein
MRGIDVAPEQAAEAVEQQLECHKPRPRESYLHEDEWAALNRSDQGMHRSPCLVRWLVP